jgi:hypothetical protein
MYRHKESVANEAEGHGKVNFREGMFKYLVLIHSVLFGNLGLTRTNYFSLQ